MRQILCNSSGALVARVPRPAVEPGSILVRVRHSMVSVGTELEPLRANRSDGTAGGLLESGKRYTSLAKTYLGKALSDPTRAVQKARQIARMAVESKRRASREKPEVVLTANDIQWTRCSAEAMDSTGGRVEITTDASAASYQAMSQPIEIKSGKVPIIRLVGEVSKGQVSIGLLNEAQDAWLGARTFDEGSFEDRLIFAPRGSARITLVVANAGATAPSRLTLETVEVIMAPPTEGGLPQSELGDVGWNVGYSVAGEVVAVGAGITEFVPGDLVACAGAGQANHAEYVVVKKHLAARLPAGCSTAAGSSVALGAIALQGVRRAEPQIGETFCVLGLGLIGQLTVQMLRANGCHVVGMDLDPRRVRRAMDLGLADGSADPEELAALVQDRTGGMGADGTLIAAASKSDVVINSAMKLTRRRGRVVVVGDVGLNIERADFYRREIDLLMSTSYGPGRYDDSFERDGTPYPFPYVRWTLTRNMDCYLRLIADGAVNVEALIDVNAPIDEATQVYELLAAATEEPPLGVVINYPDDERDLPEPADATRVTIRGHRRPHGEPIRYALVGAGAFGTSMLVPQLKKTRLGFFLGGVVSRDAVRGGNFARQNQVEVLASDLENVVADPDFDLFVIATRHHEHAAQVVTCLEAGKDVFVEKPLALTWEELDSIIAAYEARDPKPLVMVGFNRRFSPALRELARQLKGRRSPLVISYRLNGGYVPPDSWIQGTQGGGRNLGEACHMYDVFRFLAGSPVASIHAAAIEPGTLPYLRNDNFCASISFRDGSLGNLIYTALGPKDGMGKERIEVFCDGDSWVVEDFQSLVRGSDQKVVWQSDEVDKGHFEQLRQLGETIVDGRAAPITFDEIVEVSAIALRVEELIHGRAATDV